MATLCRKKAAFFLTTLLSLFYPSACHGCEDDCSCSQTTLSCQCISNDFACVLEHISTATRRLNFTIRAQNAQPVNLETANLGRFENLTELVIGAPYDEREKRLTYLSGLDEDNTFVGLDHLETLRLNLFLKSRTDLSPGVFAPLPALVELDLSYTHLVRFAQLKEAFTKLSSKTLKRLRLRNSQSYTSNPGFEWKLDLRDFLQPLETLPLEVLDISRNALLHVDPGIFRQHHLKELYFHDNFIRVDGFYTEVFFHPTLQISVGDYQGCAAASDYKPKLYHDWVDPLDHWTKSNPSMDVVPEAAYTLEHSARSSDHLQDLVSTFSQERVPSGPDSDLSSVIGRSPNKMGKFGSGYFICLLLKLFVQAWPWLQGIHCMDFPDVGNILVGKPCLFGIQLPLGPRLSEYHLAHFSYYQGGFGTPMEGTYCFDPKNNNIKLLDFSGLEQWGKLYSKNVNKIRITGLVRLEVFVLEDSAFEVWNLNMLGDFRSLRVVNGRGNRIHLENDTHAQFFSNNTQLQEIILSQNGLPSIPAKEFSHLAKLQILDLGQNELTDVSFALPTSGNLRMLKLDGNEISILPVQMREQLDEIAAKNKFQLHVDLSDNYLSCGCDDMDFIKWMQETHVNFVKVASYQCQGSHSGGQSITAIDLKQLDSLCNPSYLVVILASVLSTLGVVTIFVMTYTLHRKRFALYHMYYTKFIRPKVTEDDIAYRFDALIAYNTLDKAWVHHTLLAEMEEIRQRRLCLHLRDFPGGGTYADVIDDFMNQCRKTVLVLSPNFFRSNWCQHEMLMAHNKLTADGVDLVELVVLAPLSADVMTATLTQLMQLKRNHILTWTENPDGKKLFWDRFEDLCKSPRRRPFVE